MVRTLKDLSEDERNKVMSAYQTMRDRLISNPQLQRSLAEHASDLELQQNKRLQQLAEKTGLSLEQVFSRECDDFLTAWSRYAIREGITENTKPPKELCFEMGVSIWPHTWKKSEDPKTVAELALKFYDSLEDPLKSMFARTVEGGHRIIGSGLWAHNAFPEIQMPHTYAAALMATKISPSQATEIKPPWSAFWISVPTGLLSSTDENGVRCEITGILVTALNIDGKTVWGYEALSKSVGLFNTRIYPEGFADEIGVEDDKWEPLSELTTADERTSLLIRRLIGNICIAISDPDNVIKRPSHRHVAKKRKARLPTTRVYRVGRPITLDVRQHIQDWVEGKKRGRITVQFLVRGHWRKQACGPKLAERKLIWIEPFWKGPEVALINVRPHTKNDHE